MGSLGPSGLPITQATNTLRHAHNGNFVRVSNTATDVQSQVSNSGVTRIVNYPLPFGAEFAPSASRTLISGLALDRRELQHNNAASGIRVINRNLFVNNSGNLQHVVTRAMGIHTSISDRESANSALGAMSARTERKVFFIDEDTGKSSGFADWQIFDASGCPKSTSEGITDVDVSPGATHDSPC